MVLSPSNSPECLSSLTPYQTSVETNKGVRQKNRTAFDNNNIKTLLLPSLPIEDDCHIWTLPQTHQSTPPGDSGLSPSHSVVAVSNLRHWPKGISSGSSVEMGFSVPICGGTTASFHGPVFVDDPRASSNGPRKLVSGFVHNGSDMVKYRRTRSGCFTCRGRRVKCDETHPVCERCKKGNRSCVYPDAPTLKGPLNQKKTKDAAAVVATSETDELKQETRLQDHRFEEEPPDKHLLFTCSNGKERTASCPTRKPSTMATRAVKTKTSLLLRQEWAHLPLDFQHHLAYFVANITNHHYSIANDGDGFFSAILPSMAVQHEPLLHAVVGFSAYHATLQKPDGQLQDFLRYYHGGVTRLLESLQRKEANNVPVLVTILQLATMEEFLGDWVNLMRHQKAALEIITHIFEPATVMDTAVGRMCLNWYSRYDNYVAIMGGFPTGLSREWFDVTMQYCQSRVEAQPESLRWKIDYRSARLRLITFDMSMLYARGSRGQLPPQAFAREHTRLTHELHDWKRSWDPSLTDPTYLITDLSYRRDPGPEDIVDAYKAGTLFHPPLFTTTLITAEWHSIVIMHLSQAAKTPPPPLLAKVREHAYAACQFFEAVERWPACPPGALVSLQPCISIAALFLPHDGKHQMWLRRKFALLDTLGFIHPTTRRLKMARLFRDPSCSRWWLPNDEGLTPVLQSIRAFADERNAAAVDDKLDNIREVRHLFVKLSLEEDKEETGNKDGLAERQINR
ncbi:hypothetical protein L249_4051 [Ophiocordyceps polyrhachis-furcata BCC 54312]|uniref:Zn(2)-C6 fungal-type domain-containing protein n=1 Tax=Ophiocordyceps polyrhachis-furcata BCC 54312 TaxID=1330021 RepID=A0A367L5Q3_9HYPO|nr:hypothetical protein L249_4051 [Ophiocordyceps polyrhachis-furcata BCC 54312]